MKFFILMCVLAPMCASDLVQDYDGLLQEHLSEPLRVRRQTRQQQQPPQEPVPQYRPYSQAPAQIKQLLQFQQARDPVVNIPAPPPPNFGAAPQGNPQVQTQAQTQGGGYRPQVQFGNPPQQPSYQNQAAAQYRPQGQPQGQPQYQQPQGQQPQYNQGQYQG
ncbi:ATP-dependent RNA helicase DHH1-like [Venturia canescens]|uniref:ATP-dependent RNA helicase DHH1-like n=1 Tax=Venturia canescens TaxID=32260 RepID=UPI001C9BC714|nr:ATP-dependent RNA helicase DHH1-like [Venturia canescens]